MIAMKKNHELFWILEVLLLTPVALFWIGVLSMMAKGTDKIFLAIVGEPFEPVRSILVTIICPLAAAWFAYKYIVENKRDKNATHKLAKVIMAVSITSIILVLVYLYGENAPR